MSGKLVIDVNQIINYSRSFILHKLKKSGCTLTSFIYGLLMGIFHAINIESGGLIVSRTTHTTMVIKFYRSVYLNLYNNNILEVDCAHNIKRSLDEYNDDNVSNIIDTIYDIANDDYKKYVKKNLGTFKKCSLI